MSQTTIRMIRMIDWFLAGWLLRASMSAPTPTQAAFCAVTGCLCAAAVAGVFGK